MKRLKYLLIFVMTACMACSDFLDVSEELAEEMTMEDVFTNPAYTRRFHRYIYTGIPDMTFMVYTNDYKKSQIGGLDNPWAACSDELKATRNNVSSIPTSGYHAGNAPHSRWMLYKQIRQCNIFLQNAKVIPGDVDEITESELVDLQATARFFRAYYHYLLVELYGPVPLMTEVVESSSGDLDFARTPLDELLSYIDKELVEVSALLPEQRINDNERVMPTKGLALAVRAKLWLYAASPLLNGGYTEALALQNRDGTSLFPDKDDSKWKKALTAMQDFIDWANTGVYELHTVYNADGTVNAAESLYQLHQIHNKEIIWAGTNHTFGAVNGDGQDRSCTPRSEGVGQTALGVLQEMVDDFFMEDGLSIDESPLYSETGFGEYKNEIPATPIMAKVEPVKYTEVSNMYLHREPRFYDAIMFQGRRWHISGNEIFFHDGGNNGKTGGMYTRTGYLPYKGFCKELYNSGTFKKKQFRPNIIFRLGEFYLLYAEILNEVNPSDRRIIEYVDRVRVRAGIPKLADIKPEIIGNKELQRKAICKEMRVELFMEGQRYFNVRRWMIAEEGEDAPQGGWVTGMNLDSKDPKIEYHKRRNVEFRTFERRMYLYPIPLNEIQKSTKLVQNPGWE